MSKRTRDTYGKKVEFPPFGKKAKPELVGPDIQPFAGRLPKLGMFRQPSGESEDDAVCRAFRETVPEGTEVAAVLDRYVAVLVIHLPDDERFVPARGGRSRPFGHLDDDGIVRIGEVISKKQPVLALTRKRGSAELRERTSGDVLGTVVAVAKTLQRGEGVTRSVRRVGIWLAIGFTESEPTELDLPGGSVAPKEDVGALTEVVAPDGGAPREGPGEIEEVDAEREGGTSVAGVVASAAAARKRLSERRKARRSQQKQDAADIQALIVEAQRAPPVGDAARAAFAAEVTSELRAAQLELDVNGKRAIGLGLSKGSLSCVTQRGGNLGFVRSVVSVVPRDGGVGPSPGT